MVHARRSAPRPGRPPTRRRSSAPTLPGVGLNFSPSQTPLAGTQGRAARSHRLRGEESRGVHEEAGIAGNQADRPVPAGAGARHRHRVHHRSLGHVHRADRRPGQGQLRSAETCPRMTRRYSRPRGGVIAVPLLGLVRCHWPPVSAQAPQAEQAAPAGVSTRSEVADDSQQLGARRSDVDRRRHARSHLGAASAAVDPGATSAPTPRRRCSSSTPPASCSEAGAGRRWLRLARTGARHLRRCQRTSSGSAATAAGRSRRRPAAATT